MDQNSQFWGNGSNNDVSLSYEEYFEILDTLHDERLSKEAIMKFKNLHEVNSFGLLYVPIYFLPPALLLNRMILGNAKRGHSGYRNFWTLLSLTWPLSCWVGYTTPIPRKLYTDLVADNTEDGTYIRQALKQSKPGLWRNISRRLFNSHYMFPEMHECMTRTEFPTDFVNPHSF